MIPQEADQGDGRKLQRRFIRTRAPNGRRHRDQIIVPELFRVILLIQIISNALLTLTSP